MPTVRVLLNDSDWATDHSTEIDLSELADLSAFLVCLRSNFLQIECDLQFQSPEYAQILPNAPVSEQILTGIVLL